MQAESTVNVRGSEHLFAAAATETAMSEEDVSFLVARLANTRSPLETKPPAGLPVVDLFHEAAGTLLLAVTGANVGAIDTASTSIPLRDSSSSAHQAVENMLTGGTQRRAVTADLCASADVSVAIACGADAAVITWDAKARGFTGAVTVTADELFAADTEFFGKVGAGKLDMKDEATVVLLAELQLFHQLPMLLNASDDAGVLPQFTMLSLVGPQIFADAHGSSSAAVDAVVAAALPLIMDMWYCAYSHDQYVKYCGASAGANARQQSPHAIACASRPESLAAPSPFCPTRTSAFPLLRADGCGRWVAQGRVGGRPG